MARPVKILFLQFASIGDVVLTSAVVRCVKQQVPNAEVHYCTRPDYAPIIAHNPHITGQHFLTANLFALTRTLRSERFDCIIDLQDSFTTRLIKALVGVRTYSVDKQSVREWLYVHWKVNAVPDRHIVDQFMAVVQPLGVKNDGEGLDYFVPYKDEVETVWLPDTHQHSFVTYAIGGRHATRRLPVDRIIELCLKIDYPVVLLGDKTDRKIAEQVVQAVGARQVYNACGLFNLNQSASLLQRARVVFAHDTGLMHIAAAFGKKVYTLWGSSTPQLGYYPYKTPFVRLEAPGLGCRPCSATGFDTCPRGHFKCMKNLPLDVEVKELRTRKNFE